MQVNVIIGYKESYADIIVNSLGQINRMTGKL
jgi:hypothetical protein